MARIELRHTTIRLVDGYSNTAAVNDTPVVDDTTLSIDTLGTPGVIPLSTRFTVVGSADVYTVTAQDANAQLDIDLDDASAGTWDITIDGNTSAAIQWDDDTATVQAAIDAITGVTAGDFLVTGTNPLFTVTSLSTGAFGDLAVVMSADFAGLTATTPTQVQSQAGGVTHDITFTPAIKAGNIPADDAAMTFTGRTLEVKVGDGNATYTENREFNYDLDRGNLDTVREGDQQPIDWTLDLTWEFITSIAGAATPTVEEAFKQTGPASVWQSSSSDPCEPYAIDIEIENNPNCDTDQIETTTIPDARYESLEHDIDAATISSAGRANSTGAISARRAKVV